MKKKKSTSKLNKRTSKLQIHRETLRRLEPRVLKLAHGAELDQQTCSIKSGGNCDG